MVRVHKKRFEIPILRLFHILAVWWCMSVDSYISAKVSVLIINSHRTDDIANNPNCITIGSKLTVISCTGPLEIPEFSSAAIIYRSVGDSSKRSFPDSLPTITFGIASESDRIWSYSECTGNSTSWRRIGGDGPISSSCDIRWTWFYALCYQYLDILPNVIPSDTPDASKKMTKLDLFSLCLHPRMPKGIFPFLALSFSLILPGWISVSSWSLMVQLLFMDLQLRVNKHVFAREFVLEW